MAKSKSKLQLAAASLANSNSNRLKKRFEFCCTKCLLIISIKFFKKRPRTKFIRKFIKLTFT